MGKWEVIYDHGWHVVDVTDKSPGGQILICDCGIDPWSEMNARKIAAAPELAEALRTARDYVFCELETERQQMKGYERISRIDEIAADLAEIDAALAKAGVGRSAIVDC